MKVALLRHFERDGWEVCAKPASICGGEVPTHDLSMSANEKVGEWHVRRRYIGPGEPPIPVLPVGRGTHVGRSHGHIEDLDAPTAYAIGDSCRVRVSNANLGQAHRIDGGAPTRHARHDRLSCPPVKRRPRESKA
jgi:hypothetical protein